MTWDWLVQRTGKYCSIPRMEYPEFQTRIFGRMESARGLSVVGLFVGHEQRSRFLVLTKRSAASGDENALIEAKSIWRRIYKYQIKNYFSNMELIHASC